MRYLPDDKITEKNRTPDAVRFGRAPVFFQYAHFPETPSQAPDSERKRTA